MGQSNKAISILVSLGVSAGAMVFGGGCADAPAPVASNNVLHSDVTDVRPIEPAAPAAYQPPVIDNSGLIPTAQQEVTTRTPNPTPAAAADAGVPLLSTTPSDTVGEKSHTVRRGETLFSIAKSTYGSGKAWKKIVAANPGVSPSKLKVGQVLAMP